MHEQLHHSWRIATQAKKLSLVAITEATDKAVERGLATGPVSVGDLKNAYPDRWRCMVRFPAAADRACDARMSVTA